MKKIKSLVILVDDIPLNNMLLKFMLSKWKSQLEIEEMQNANGLLEAIKNSLYDKILIFLDLQMPLMDGYQFLKIWGLERTRINKNVLIVVVSATELCEFKTSGYLELLEDYFMKPVDAGKLEVVVNNFLAI